MNIAFLLNNHDAPDDDDNAKMDSILNLSNAEIDDDFSLGSLDSVKHINSQLDNYLSSLTTFPNFLSHIPPSLLGQSLTSMHITTHPVRKLICTNLSQVLNLEI